MIKPRVTILSALLESGALNFSLDGLVDLFSLDLNSHIQFDKVHNVKVCLASDFSSLQVIVPYQLSSSKESKLAMLGLDFSTLKSNLPELLRLMTRATYFREIAVNLRFCYEKMRMSFQDIQRKIKGFLMDLELEDDPLVLLKLKQFISTGTQNEKINEFLRNLNIKKIAELRTTVGGFLSNCRSLLLDTFKTGLSRMLVILSFLKPTRPGLFDTLDETVKQALFVIDSIVSKSLAKEIQMRNFFTFLYQYKLKTISPKKVVEYENEELSRERLDHYQLLQLLTSKESLYLKDFLNFIEKTHLEANQQERKADAFGEHMSAPFVNNQLEEAFDDLIQDLDITMPETSHDVLDGSRSGPFTFKVNSL